MENHKHGHDNSNPARSHDEQALSPIPADGDTPIPGSVKRPYNPLHPYGRGAVTGAKLMLMRLSAPDADRVIHFACGLQIGLPLAPNDAEAQLRLAQAFFLRAGQAFGIWAMHSDNEHVSEAKTLRKDANLLEVAIDTKTVLAENYHSPSAPAGRPLTVPGATAQPWGPSRASKPMKRSTHPASKPAKVEAPAAALFQRSAKLEHDLTNQHFTEEALLMQRVKELLAARAKAATKPAHDTEATP